MTRSELRNLHPSDYEHPLDAKSLDLLEGTPGLEILVKTFIKHGIERLMTLSYTGSHLRVLPTNFPDLFDLFQDVCATINIQRLPRLFVKWDSDINAMTIGDEEPIIIVNSGAVDRLSGDEMRFVIGHEMGHIKSRHTRYHMMAEGMSFFGEVIGDLTFNVGKLLVTPVQAALRRWYRMSELSADRVGLLACQSLHDAAAVFVKIAGLPARFNLTPCVEDFLTQAREFEELDIDKVNRWMKFAAHTFKDHPWTVLRAAELSRWVDSGQYKMVLDRATPTITRQPDDSAWNVESRCESCGVVFHQGDVFCGNCGAAVPATEQARNQ